MNRNKEMRNFSFFFLILTTNCKRVDAFNFSRAKPQIIDIHIYLVLRFWHPYLVGLTVSEHAKFAIGHDFHTVTLYSGRIEILVRHHVLRVSGAAGVRGYLADLIDDLLAGGVHVPADQAIIARCNARCAWFLHIRAHLLAFCHCRGHHRSTELLSWKAQTFAYSYLALIASFFSVTFYITKKPQGDEI